MTKDCAYFAVQISAYLDDMLEEEETRELMAHLAHCPACSALFADLTELSQEMKDWPVYSPPGDLSALVMEKVKAEQGRKRVVYRSLAAIAAVLVVALLGVGALQLVSPPSDSTAQLSGEGKTQLSESQGTNFVNQNVESEADGAPFRTEGTGSADEACKNEGQMAAGGSIQTTQAPLLEEETGTLSEAEPIEDSWEVTASTSPPESDMTYYDMGLGKNGSCWNLPLMRLFLNDRQENSKTYFAILTVVSDQIEQLGAEELGRQEYESLQKRLEEEKITFTIQTYGAKVDPLSNAALIVYLPQLDSAGEVGDGHPN